LFKLQALKYGKDSIDDMAIMSPHEWDDKSLSLKGVEGGHMNIVVQLIV